MSLSANRAGTIVDSPRYGWRMEPEWSRAQDAAQRHAWEQILMPVAAELTSAAREMSAQLARAIGDRLPGLLPDAESFEANRASNEASILGFAEILEQGADPAATSLGQATLAYTKQAAQRGIPMTRLIRSYRLGHAAAWDGITPLIAAHATDPEQRAIAIELCSAWLFAYVDAALCLAEDFYSAERERWVAAPPRPAPRRSTRFSRDEPIDAALAGRRLGYELDRQHTAVIAWLESHEEGRDTHAAMEAAIAQIQRSSRRQRALSSTPSVVCRPPPGSEPRHPPLPASSMTCGSTRIPPPGSGSRSENPVRASPGFVRATTRRRTPAASRSSPLGPPGRSRGIHA